MAADVVLLEGLDEGVGVDGVLPELVVFAVLVLDEFEQELGLAAAGEGGDVEVEAAGADRDGLQSVDLDKLGVDRDLVLVELLRAWVRAVVPLRMEKR